MSVFVSFLGEGLHAFCGLVTMHSFFFFFYYACLFVIIVHLDLSRFWRSA